MAAGRVIYRVAGCNLRGLKTGQYLFRPHDSSKPSIPAIVQRFGRYPPMVRFFTADGMRDICFVVSAAEARRHGQFVPLVPIDECGNAGVGLGNGHEHIVSPLSKRWNGAVQHSILNGKHNGSRGTRPNDSDKIFRNIVLHELRDSRKPAEQHHNDLAATTAVDRAEFPS